MNRSGYSDDCEHLELYRANVERSIRGKRGQAFLHELAVVLDAMQERELIADALIDENGSCCAIGAVCRARDTDVSKVDYYCPASVGRMVGISTCLAAEIEAENDLEWMVETPAERWVRMREWVRQNIVK